jgi:hypothetical protein
MRLLFALVWLLVLSGCTSHNIHAPAAETPETLNPSFLDIQGGMRLRVVTPILKSGGYVAKTLTEVTAGDPTNLRIGDDYVGYANDYYLAKPHGAGVRIAFQSAETVKQGKSAPQLHPALELFRLPLQMRYVRLVYLVRASRADHNTAIVAGDTKASLVAATHQVQTDPDTGCQRALHTYCSWVPAGVGIQPENSKKADTRQ